MALKVSESDYFKQNSIHLLSTVLSRLIEVNDQSTDRNARSTRFHSVSVPDIPLQKYLKRISRYTDCNYETLVCAVMYLLRVSRRSSVLITSLSVHRLLITSIVIAMKYIEDECYTNRYMAKVGGISLAELNRLEVSFLKKLDFCLCIHPENFEQFCTEICRLDNQIMMEEISARLPVAASEPKQIIETCHRESRCGPSETMEVVRPELLC
jgi:Cyclin